MNDSRNMTCSCGNYHLRVEVRKECATCEHNGFYIDEEVAEELGLDIDPYDRGYDEELRKKISDHIGVEVERDEAYDNGSCKMGEPQGDGCWIFFCDECGKKVDFVPVASC